MRLTDCNTSLTMKHKNNTTSKKVPEPVKVFDVRRPGRTSVSATSRPVIVGHKPQVQDPMVSRDTERPGLMDSAQKVTVQPATAPVLPDAPELTVTPTLPSEPIPPVVTAETPELPVPSVPSSAPSVPDEITADISEISAAEPDAEAAADLAVVALKDTATVDTDSTPADTPPQNAVSSAPEVPTVSAQSVVSESKADEGYFEFPVDEPAQSVQHSDKPLPDLPQEPSQASGPQIYVSHHPHRSAGKTIWICLVLLIALVAAFDILLDAGFMVIDKIPHTTFFQ